jgi:hypothetical protein
VVGRHLPTDAEPTPTVYRMKVWANDAVRAKSKFWYAPHARTLQLQGSSSMQASWDQRRRIGRTASQARLCCTLCRAGTSSVSCAV